MTVGTVIALKVDDLKNPAVKTGDTAEVERLLGLNAVQSVKFVN